MWKMGLMGETLFTTTTGAVWMSVMMQQVSDPRSEPFVGALPSALWEL